MRPAVVLSWEAFDAAVVDFDAEDARRHRTRRFAAAAVKNLVPLERRFDLSAFACST